MIRAVLKTGLRVIRFLAHSPCVLILLLSFPATSQGDLPAPIEIRDSIPREDAGIINYARVPEETGFAVLIHAVHGIDTRAPDTVRFLVDDGRHLPYVRDLSNDTVRMVTLNENDDQQATSVWAVYDRFLEPSLPTGYPAGAVVNIKVEVRDIRNNRLQPLPFEFKVEAPAGRAAYGQNLLQIDEFYNDDEIGGDPRDAGIEIIDGALCGAKVLYSSREPLTPIFEPADGMDEIDLAGVLPAGAPLNLSPHSVFDIPVKLFIPVADDVDIAAAGLAYYDGTGWLIAADADGNVLAGGEGWMVPGSRIDHRETHPALIEVQVHHFSGAEAVIIIGGTEDEQKPPPDDNGSQVVVFANCFIKSAAGDANLGWLAALIGVIVVFLVAYFTLRTRRRTYYVSQTPGGRHRV